MGLLDDAIREHLELKRRAGADPSEVERLERDAFGPAQGAPEPPPPPPEPVAAEPPPEPEPEPAPTPPSLQDTQQHTAAHQPEPWLDEPDEVPFEDQLSHPPRKHRRPEPPRPPAEEEQAPAPTEDVLEETPDFLQETPEHDRLWFEQRPPKDFDFGNE